jgi:small-conductance mechanosensitive channel
MPCSGTRSSRAGPSLKEQAMKNVGTIDRTIRIVAVVAIAAVIMTGLVNGTLALVLGIIGVVLLLTALTSTCPGYLPFGLSTRARVR